MRLAGAPAAYDPGDQARLRQALQKADDENLKRGRDVRLQNGERLILKDTVTGNLYAVSIASGSLTVSGPL